MTRPGTSPWIAALLVLLLSPGTVSAQAEGMPVVVEPVRSETARRIEPVLGHLVARRQGVVASRVAAPVEAVEVEIGDRVDKGAVLVRLDARRLALEYELARAEMEIARSELREAERTLKLHRQERDRLERLKGSAAYSRARFEDKTQEVAIAAARLEIMRARLERARVQLRFRRADLEDSVVRAPYAGVVTGRPARVGQYVRIGDPVVALLDDRSLEVEVDLPMERLAGLGADEPVGIRIQGRRLEARLRAVVPVENPQTRTRAVRFRLVEPPPAGTVAVGQTVQVELPTGEAGPVLTVAKDAVLLRRGRHTVFVVVDGVAEPRRIEIGRAIDGRLEVLEGLEEGERVVIRGNERLRPGQKVRPLPASAAGDVQG